ncbi:Uncharacterised protein [Halioglobus japonicus]|nr:Uncharacterised protein [Halioglobus japonicus]
MIQQGSIVLFDVSNASILLQKEDSGFYGQVSVGGGRPTYVIDTDSHQVVWSYPTSDHLSVAEDGSWYIPGEGTLVSISLQ